MTAVGHQKFRTILQKLLRKSQGGHVRWRWDAVERVYVVDFEEGSLIEVFQKSPPGEPQLAGAILRIDGEIVAAHDAQQDDEDWELLHALYDEAERRTAREESGVQGIEQALESDKDIGGLPDEETPGETTGGPPTTGRFSLDDLTDGDSPFDEGR